MSELAKQMSHHFSLCQNVVATTSSHLFPLISWHAILTPGLNVRPIQFYKASHPCLVEGANVSEEPAASFSVEYGDTSSSETFVPFYNNIRRQIQEEGNVHKISRIRKYLNCEIQFIANNGITENWNISWPNALLCTWSRSQEALCRSEGFAN